jgi:hypothetical protein
MNQFIRGRRNSSGTDYILPRETKIFFGVAKKEKNSDFVEKNIKKILLKNNFNPPVWMITV